MPLKEQFEGFLGEGDNKNRAKVEKN